jgi:hypothetical protein
MQTSWCRAPRFVAAPDDLTRQLVMLFDRLADHERRDLDAMLVEQVERTRNALVHAVVEEGIRHLIGVAGLDRFGQGTACAGDRLPAAFKHQGDADRQPCAVRPERSRFAEHRRSSAFPTARRRHGRGRHRRQRAGCGYASEGATGQSEIFPVRHGVSSHCNRQERRPGIWRNRCRPTAGSPGRLMVQIWVMPPSTNSSAPLMKLASSDARNSAALAISSGLPTRPTGIWVAR